MPVRRNLDKLMRLYNEMDAYQQSNGYPPSLRDIMEMGFATTGSLVRYYYNEMVELGMMTYQPGIHRSARLLPLNKADARIRKLAKVAK